MTANNSSAITAETQNAQSSTSSALKIDRILRYPQVIALTGLSKSTLQRMQLQQRFPARIQLGPRSVGFRESEVMAYIQNREAVVGQGGPHEE